MSRLLEVLFELITVGLLPNIYLIKSALTIKKFPVFHLCVNLLKIKDLTISSFT